MLSLPPIISCLLPASSSVYCGQRREWRSGREHVKSVEARKLRRIRSHSTTSRQLPILYITPFERLLSEGLGGQGGCGGGMGAGGGRGVAPDLHLSTMLFGPRPTLGWLGYLMLKGSWYRLAVLLCLLGLVTVGLVHRSQHTVTLHHSIPSPFPPPVMFLPTPSHSYMTPLDACSVEAAGKVAVKEGGAGKDAMAGGLDGFPGRRQVYVYLWATSMGPADVWGRWVARLPRVTVNLLDVPRTVNRTPVKGLAKLIGWTANYPEWMTWTAARVAVLWLAGGVVLPLGVVPTRSVWLEPLQPRVMLATRLQGGVDSVVFGASPHHPVLAAASSLLEAIAEGKTPNQSTDAEELLTEAVKAGCGVKTLDSLPSPKCSAVTLLPGNAVFDMASSKDIHEAEGASFLRATGEPGEFLHLPSAHHLFASYQLARYCPKTAHQLDAMYRQNL